MERRINKNIKTEIIKNLIKKWKEDLKDLENLVVQNNYFEDHEVNFINILADKKSHYSEAFNELSCYPYYLMIMLKKKKNI